MRDGTPHFTLRLNGLLTLDLSVEVGLRWKSLPEETGKRIISRNVGVVCVAARVFCALLTLRQRAAA